MQTAVLGGGVTGLAVASTCSDATVYEATEDPGGICGSYHRDGYRFEVGGGHWIFGGSPEVLDLLHGLTPLVAHERRASVHFAGVGRSVPYPFQDHVAELDPQLAVLASGEGGGAPTGPTMAHWLEARFGPSLCDRFFHPFHERYTAGLFRELAPQDAYKSPQGQQGYNTTFRYPPAGLDVLTRALASGSDVRYGHRVTAIDTDTRVLAFADGTEAGFDQLVCTLPLDVTLELCGIGPDQAGPPDPHTSVVVVNIGGTRGPACPTDHWVYDAESIAGFHRYGIYSNVDRSFVPEGDPGRVALYVEHAVPGGQRPEPADEQELVRATVDELVSRGVVDRVEVVDVSWVPSAYTWTRPGSTWVADALDLLAARGVQQVGRYARWHFQGIADSVAEGLAAGRALSRANQGSDR